MGCTETTLYTIAIYTSAVGIKKIRFVLIAALIADIVRYAFFCYPLPNFVNSFFDFVDFCRILSQTFS